MPFHLRIDVMKQLLAINKDAVREVTSRGWLPVHTAARYNTVEVIEFLLDLYPESSSMVTNYSCCSLLRLAVIDTLNTTSVMEAKVRFLCSRYPSMVLQIGNSGMTPLHYVTGGQYHSAVMILCEVGGQD